MGKWLVQECLVHIFVKYSVCAKKKYTRHLKPAYELRFELICVALIRCLTVGRWPGSVWKKISKGHVQFKGP